MNDVAARAYEEMKRWYIEEAKARNQYYELCQTYQQMYGNITGIYRLKSRPESMDLYVRFELARNMVVMNATVVLAACAYETAYTDRHGPPDAA